MEPKPLSSEPAAAIWQRAAQLQAEAAQRLEERSRALSASAESPDHDGHDFSVDEVRAAAVEAGIAAEFVALALAEQSADAIGPLRRDQQDAATRFLGTPERLLELSRTVDQPIDVVYASLQRVLPAPPWNLALRDIAGRLTRIVRQQDSRTSAWARKRRGGSASLLIVIRGRSRRFPIVMMAGIESTIGMETSCGTRCCCTTRR